VPLPAKVCVRINLKQQQNFAEPNVIHSERKGPVRNPWWSYEDKVLTICPPQLFLCKRMTRNALLIGMLNMPDSKRVEQCNMPLATSGMYFSQSSKQSPVL
jgi:hypothetical protein